MYFADKMSADSVETSTPIPSEEVLENNENEEMLSGSDSEDNTKESDISPQKDGKLIKQIIREGKGLSDH